MDRRGAYHAEGGADALFLRDRSLPAASTREWAVADPARVRVEACGKVAAEDVRGDRVESASYLVEGLAAAEAGAHSQEGPLGHPTQRGREKRSV